MMPRYSLRSFTLVETLLGLVIFAVIAVGLYGVLSGALKLDKRVKGMHARGADVRAAFDVISRDLENAVAYPFVKGKSDRLGFEGKADRVSFFLPTDEGIFVVDYYAGDIDFGTRATTRVRRVKNVREMFDEARGDQKRQFFVRRLKPLTALLAGNEQGVMTQALATGLNGGGVSLSYGVFSKDAAGQRQVKFQREWSDNALPDVIVIELQFDGLIPGQVERVSREIYPVAKGPVI